MFMRLHLGRYAAAHKHTRRTAHPAGMSQSAYVSPLSFLSDQAKDDYLYLSVSPAGVTSSAPTDNGNVGFPIALANGCELNPSRGRPIPQATAPNLKQRPNHKHQASTKLQITSTKSQIRTKTQAPNLKQAPNHKHQLSNKDQNPNPKKINGDSVHQRR